MQENLKNKITEYILFLISFCLFYFFYSQTLNYGRTFDDDLIIDRFIKSPGDAKLLSSYFYARFHFYPIYFLSHELDNFLTFFLNFFNLNIFNSQIAKFTNIFLHISNSFLIIVFLKKIFDANDNLRSNLIFYFSSLFFLFHPTTSQVVFNITTRNESLALFFGLLTFIYCFKLINERKAINFIIVGLLFFFSLCSKLMTVFFVGLIPLTIFLKNYHKENLKKNYKTCYDIFLALLAPFIIFYFLRNKFVLDTKIIFFSEFKDLIFYFFTTFKFYIRGLFFPYEHIYVYAANYDLKFSIILFIIFFLILIFSIYIFFKNKDPYLLIIFTWISASLSVPILFGLIQQGFPLISNLAERYQYSSVVCIPIIVSWFLLKLNKNLYKNMFLYFSFSIILALSTIIQIDRSKVYIDNAHFFTQAYYESPRNAHFYNFMVPKTEALKNQDLNKYLFFLHQLYSGDPKNEKWIFEYIKYFEFKNNKIGSQFFENEFEKYYNDQPKQKFEYANFLFTHEKFEKSKIQINEILAIYDAQKKAYDDEERFILFLNPGLDDLYYTLGLIEYNLGNNEEALKNFKKANITNPKHATALYNAAIVLKKMGLVEEAKNLFTDAIKINPFLRETVTNILSNAE